MAPQNRRRRSGEVAVVIGGCLSRFGAALRTPSRGDCIQLRGIGSLQRGRFKLDRNRPIVRHLNRSYRMPRNVAVGVGLMEFPFSGADAFWRWVDLCEAGGVDSIWQTDRLVSPQPFLECMS